MNRYTTYLAGGALLATTALASGTVSVQAATIVSYAGVASGTAVPTTFTAKELSTQVFGGTAAQNSAVDVSLGFVILGSNSYAASTTALVLNVTGAEFNTTAPTINMFESAGTAASVVTVNGAVGSGILMFTDHIILSSLSRTYTGVEVVNPKFRNLQGLATAGATVALSGVVQNAAQTTTFENITSRTVLTSKTPVTVSITSAGTTANNASTPAFANFGSSTALTLVAGTIALTSVTGYATDLTTLMTGSGLVSSLEVRIAHASLTDSAFNSVSITTSGGSVIATKSAAQIASGVATFTTTNSVAFGGAESLAVVLTFNGTTTITGTSGTQAVTATATPLSTLSAPAATTGSLGNISRGGLSSNVNGFQNSFNSIPSLLRIHNGGTNSGTYTVIVRQGDATASNAGTALGTYTGGSIAPNSTIQLGAGTLETGAGITTPTTFGNYTLSVTGTFNGYVQHLTYSGSTGVVSNLSAYRNGGTGGGTGGVP